jgi:hypothetical protein
MDLLFIDADLARLCNRQAELLAFAGSGASALRQLLYELHCADNLGMAAELPHVSLRRAPEHRVAVAGADDANVLLQGEIGRLSRVAEQAIVVAVSVYEAIYNPEGAEWPQAPAMSRTMR